MLESEPAWYGRACPTECADAATDAERRLIRDSRRGWLAEDAEQVAARYRRDELDALDLVRRYGVIVDWESGELLPETTRTFRAMLVRRASAHWTG